MRLDDDDRYAAFLSGQKVCADCGHTYEVRDCESTNEIRCGSCQVAFRLRGSDKPKEMSHKDHWFWKMCNEDCPPDEMDDSVYG